MATLTLPSSGTLRIASCTESSDPYGDIGRSESGMVRTDSTGHVTVWQFVTGEYALATARSIQAELLGTPPITVSGDLIGGTIDVHPRRVRLVYGTDGGSIVAAVSFELEVTELL